MKAVLIIFSILMWSACIDHTLPPEFKSPKDSIIADVQKIISAETVQIDGFKIPKKDTVLLWLNVGIINPKNLPQDHDMVMDMRKRIAVIVKNALKDPKQFKVYDIAISYQKVTKDMLGMKTVQAQVLDYDQFDVNDF